jgi:bifunctional non-homologous end joining protein LigD
MTERLVGLEKEIPPGRIKPMLAKKTVEPFSKKGWFFEIKWDGFRALANIGNKGVDIYSRHGKSFNFDMSGFIRQLKSVGQEFILDGEIVAVDKEGKADFDALRKRDFGKTVLVYYVFDLLHLDGYNTRLLPLSERKELLRRLLPDLPGVKISEHIEVDGVGFFKQIQQFGLEGLMAKNAASSYTPDTRSKEWLKVKHYKRQGWKKKVYIE